jgi:AcrR family transcriptional regulator
MKGRPRSPECDRAILDAALVEYARYGFDGLNVDAVAARAGVSKATIYRRYPSKVDLVMAAAFAICDEATVEPDTGSLSGDVRTALQNLRRLVEDPVFGAAKRMLVADALRNEELAEMHADLVRTRRARHTAIFRRAIERGEMRPDVDIEFANDALSSPLFYRAIIMHQPVDDAYIEEVVRSFMASYGVLQGAG